MSRRRYLRPLHWDGRSLVGADGRRLIDASSNDYLGLSQHSLTRTRAAQWAERHGAGAPSSRLITGTRDITLAVEEKLADFKHCEAALLFNTGFQANATVIPALAAIGSAAPQSRNSVSQANDTIIFSDSLNHSSLVHGCRLAKARTFVFRHNDLDYLADLLVEHQANKSRRLILTESVFSMDGDCANLAGLVALAEKHGAALYVDEAHATGVLGKHGRGLAADAPGVDIVMGTLGKGFGAFGAYVAGSHALIDYLVNRCAGFIYTTALPPAVLGAIDAALELIPGMDVERARLDNFSKRLRRALDDAGFDTLRSASQIIPAILGTESAALAAAQQLNDAGVLAVAIRPPTVPEGTSRLRFSLSSALSEGDMLKILESVSRIPNAPTSR